MHQRESLAKRFNLSSGRFDLGGRAGGNLVHLDRDGLGDAALVKVFMIFDFTALV